MRKADSMTDEGGDGGSNLVVAPSSIDAVAASIAAHKAALLAGRLMARCNDEHTIRMALAAEFPGVDAGHAMFEARKTFNEWKEGNKRAKRDEALQFYLHIIRDCVGTVKDQLRAREKLNELLGLEKKHADGAAQIPLPRLSEQERLAAIQRLELEAARENGETLRRVESAEDVA